MSALEPWEVEEILALIRAGRAVVETGGSRAGTTVRGHPDAGFSFEHHDEGATWSTPATEAQVRATILGEPARARHAARNAVRRALAGSLRDGDAAAARAAIADAARFGGPSAADRLLLALLDPGPPEDPALADALRAEIDGFTFWHLVLDALGWERTAASGARGLALLDVALTRIGPPTPAGADRVRAAFQGLIDAGA